MEDIKFSPKKDKRSSKSKIDKLKYKSIMNKSVNQPIVSPIIEDSEDPKSDGISSVSPDVSDINQVRSSKNKSKRQRESSMAREHLHKVKHLKVSINSYYIDII